jgi:hypothetical protein
MKQLIIVLVGAFFLIQCTSIRDTGNTGDVLSSFCVDIRVDSLLPLIKGLDSLVCYEYNTNLSDTVYVSSNCRSLVNAAFMQNIISCFAKNSTAISFTGQLKFPVVIIEAKYDKCKYILNVGIMKGHLDGHGSEFELIKDKGSYRIGKAVGLWVS